MSSNAKSRTEPDSEWSVAMPSNLAGLKQGLNGLGAWLERHRVDVETENRARLVFEEIVTNVMRYGFASADDGAHIVRSTAHIDGGGEVTLSFDDDGKPFDPVAAPALSHADSLAHASVGGRGLMLVRAAAKSIQYERTQDGRNRLTVTLSGT